MIEFAVIVVAALVIIGVVIEVFRTLEEVTDDRYKERARERAYRDELERQR